MILQENNTHKAVKEGNKIKIYTKGFELGKPTDEDYFRYDYQFPPQHPIFQDEYLYSIPAEDEDDLFAIFERLDEDNRCLFAEANAEFKK